MDPVHSNGVLAAAGLVITLIVLVWRWLHGLEVARLRERANDPLAVDAADQQAMMGAMGLGASPGVGAEMGAVAGVTAAEFMWNWATIDPDLIHAANFSSTAAIHSGLGFAEYLHGHYDSLGSAAKESFQHRLLGYVGKQQAAHALHHAGHSVLVATAANHPAWDMLVDGHAANIKTVSDIASIKAEAAAHHGILYLVPEDAHGHAADNIVRLAGFKHDAARESLKQGLAHANGSAAVHGLSHHLPCVTIAFAVHRNYQAVQHGQSVETAVKHAAIETAGRGVGVVAGAKVGLVAGLMFGPVGSMIGSVAGGIVGGLTGGRIAENVKRKELDAALASLQAALHTFGQSFEPRLDMVRGYLRAYLSNLQKAHATASQEALRRKASLKFLLWPDFYTIAIDEAAKRGAVQVAEETRRFTENEAFLSHGSRTGDYSQLGLLMVNAVAIREIIGFDAALLEGVSRAQNAVFAERKKLDPAFVPPTGAVA